MCGRIAQYSDLRVFASGMGWDSSIAEHAGDRRPRYNVGPQTGVWIFHQLSQGGMPACDEVRWGYKPAWANSDLDRKLPSVINARIEGVTTKPYYRNLWSQSRRIIVPADGWYEWPVIDGTKRPQFISRTDGPCYFAGLASITDRTAPDQAGMVIITSDADGGLVDVHDRRPVALNESDARLWLDPALQPEAAEQLMHYGMLPSAAFRWWEVTKAVGNVRNEGSQLAMPLA